MATRLVRESRNRCPLCRRQEAAASAKVGIKVAAGLDMGGDTGTGESLLDPLLDLVGERMRFCDMHIGGDQQLEIDKARQPAAAGPQLVHAAYAARREAEDLCAQPRLLLSRQAAVQQGAGGLMRQVARAHFGRVIPHSKKSA